MFEGVIEGISVEARSKLFEVPRSVFIRCSSTPAGLVKLAGTTENMSVMKRGLSVTMTRVKRRVRIAPMIAAAEVAIPEFASATVWIGFPFTILTVPCPAPALPLGTLPRKRICFVPVATEDDAFFAALLLSIRNACW